MVDVVLVGGAAVKVLADVLKAKGLDLGGGAGAVIVVAKLMEVLLG